MADEPTTQDEEETDDDAESEDEGLGDESYDDEDVPDPFEALQRIAEELQPEEDEGTGQVARVRAIADGLREKLTAFQKELEVDAGTKPIEVADAVRALLDAQLFMQEELSETIMPYLAGVATSSRDNVADIRDWGEEEIEPLLDRIAEGAVDSVGEGSVLAPNDGKAIDTLLGELHYVLSSHVKDLDSASDERKAVETRLGHIETMRKHVQKITLPDEAIQA